MAGRSFGKLRQFNHLLRRKPGRAGPPWHQCRGGGAVDFLRAVHHSSLELGGALERRAKTRVAIDMDGDFMVILW